MSQAPPEVSLVALVRREARDAVKHEYKVKPNMRKDLRKAMAVAEGIIKAEGQGICGRGLDGPFGLPGGLEDSALHEGGKRPANGAPGDSPAAKKKKKK